MAIHGANANGITRFNAMNIDQVQILPPEDGDAVIGNVVGLDEQYVHKLLIALSSKYVDKTMDNMRPRACVLIRKASTIFSPDTVLP